MVVTKLPSSHPLKWVFLTPGSEGYDKPVASFLQQTRSVRGGVQKKSIAINNGSGFTTREKRMYHGISMRSRKSIWGTMQLADQPYPSSFLMFTPRPFIALMLFVFEDCEWRKKDKVFGCCFVPRLILVVGYFVRRLYTRNVETFRQFTFERLIEGKTGI